MNGLIKSIFTLQIVPCHRLDSRSIRFGSKKFPICSRCMAILLGYLAIPFLVIFKVHIAILIGVVMNVPMLADGFTQKWKWRKSNNFFRIVTGLLTGIGLSIAIVSIALDVTEMIIRLGR